MTSYLVDTSYEDGHVLRTFENEEALAAYLTKNIQEEHYSGLSDQIHGIYRYDGLGKFTELTLTSLGEDKDEDDYLHWEFHLLDANRVLYTFTVRIDGRA